MPDTQTDLRRIIAAADRAAALANDPLLVGAFDTLHDRFLSAWLNSPADRPELRERLWHHIQALGEVRAELSAVLNDGTMARAALDELQDPTPTP